jgi:hypothetical protein
MDLLVSAPLWVYFWRGPVAIGERLAKTQPHQMQASHVGFDDSH